MSWSWSSRICLPKSNINWGHKEAHSTLNQPVNMTRQDSTYMIPYKEKTFTSTNQPGGTTVILTLNWTSQVIDHGTDPYGLGRWNFLTLRGKNGKKILLVTAYRVCSQSAQSCVQTNSTAQQHRQLSKKWRNYST